LCVGRKQVSITQTCHIDICIPLLLTSVHSTPSHTYLSPASNSLTENDSPKHSTDGVDSPEDNNTPVHEDTALELPETHHPKEPSEGKDGGNAPIDPTPQDEHATVSPDVPVDLTLGSNTKATSTPACEDSDLLQPLIEACKEPDAVLPSPLPPAAAVESLQLVGPVSISYHYFPWIAAYNISSCLPNDVIQMHSEGCFDLPTHTILDQFMEQYFLHVHPLLPLLNEADFWNLYSSQRRADWEPLSLLVIQSMIFASSTVGSVSRGVVKDSV
jgi:hypothetical protein